MGSAGEARSSKQMNYIRAFEFLDRVLEQPVRPADITIIRTINPRDVAPPGLLGAEDSDLH